MKETILDDFGANEASYEFFRDFFVIDQAEFVVNLLKTADIPYQLDKSTTIIDESIVGNSLTPKFILRLPPSFFQQANDLIKANLVVDTHYIKDHYLNQMDDKELVEILEKSDEWSLEDGVIAQKILENRGIVYDELAIQQMQADRLVTLRAGKEETLGIILSYFLLILGASFFFSAYFIFAGLGLAWYYWKDTNVDTTGHKYYSFDASTRQLGKIVFYVWLIFMIPFFLLGLPLIWLGDVFSFSG